MTLARTPDQSPGRACRRMRTDGYQIILSPDIPYRHSGLKGAITSTGRPSAPVRWTIAVQKHSFSTILADVGLGIGIDYGNIRFMRIAGDLTVVGTPVVYATRMSSAPAGKSVLNQPAYEKIVIHYRAFCSTTETEFDIKHEGRVLAHEVRLKKRSFTPADPPWLAC